MTGNRNPGALAALPHKTTADNGGAFGELLQPKHQAAFVADVATTGTYATDDDAIVAAINSIKDALVNAGIMKAS